MKHIKLYSSDYFFTKYKKVGVEIEKISRTSKDKHLYRLNMTEFKDKRFSYMLKCGLNSSIDGLKNDVVKLGGESKLAAFTHTFKTVKVIDKLEQFYDKQVIKSDKLKIIVITPMIMDNFDKSSAEFLSTGKPEYIGGFDMARNTQRTRKKAIPSGSVLVIKDDKFKDKSIKYIYDHSEKFHKLDKIKNSKQRYKGFGSIIIMPFNEK